MPRGDRAKAGVLGRIASSAHSVVVKYPPARTPVTGTAPSILPIAPLTGPAPTPTVIPGAAPTPEKPDVTLQCLWYDSPTDTALGVNSNRRSYGVGGWRQGATALIRVAVKDAALDPTKPYEKTVFDECEAVVHAGLRYRVLGLTRSDAGSAEAYTYYVWLSTSEVI
jgi:hypothetical protein